jgi:signal peptidase II
MKRSAWVLFVAVFLVTAALDQGSKVWARGLPTQPSDCGSAALHCHGVPQPVIAGYWDWELAMNPGAAFSTMIAGTGAQLLLTVIALCALVALGIAAGRTRAEERGKRIALALIAGGALGNLIDRVRDGAVTDFVRWRFHDHLWPIFNVADAALLVGVVVLLVTSRKTSPSSPPGRTIAA